MPPRAGGPRLAWPMANRPQDAIQDAILPYGRGAQPFEQIEERTDAANELVLGEFANCVVLSRTSRAGRLTRWGNSVSFGIDL